MKKIILLSIILTLSTQSPALTVTRLVPNEYTTIQAAIDDCNDGDTVIVSPGTYLEKINFNGRNITLTGTDPDDPKIVATTTIKSPSPPSPQKSNNTRGGQTIEIMDSVVTFENGETSEAVLTGFTIKDGYGTFLPVEFVGRDTITGGGILCFNSSPTIEKNVIINNNNEIAVQLLNIEGWGAGIGCFLSGATITHNIIMDNSATLGGGILAILGDAKITNNLIYNNSATAGGGILLLDGSLLNNTIVNNNAYDSGANVYFVSYQEFGPCTALSNIISYPHGSGNIFREGSIPEDRIEFNNIWDGGGNIFMPAIKTKDDLGNIYMDPMFVNLQANDFRLQTDSPCINAGDPNYIIEPAEKDMYGNNRFIHGRIDMGAAEFDGNLRPVAFAGDDQSLKELPEFVILDASRSYDPDGNQNLTYHWSQVSGISVTIKDANTPVATFSPTEYGAYTFEVVISDGRFESLPDSVCIVIDNGYIPVADAGLPVVYTDGDAVTLDGTKSYDPDNSGELLYIWEQISGPPVVITDSNTPTPEISGIVQTDALQICEFQLLVYDGQYVSLPDIAEVRIFPFFSGISYRLENNSFDPNKPTFIYFGGGDCINGSGSWNDNEWEDVVNVLSFSYQPDPSDTGRTYYRYGDMIIQYLSKVAPNYNQKIQTSGHSTGGQPAIDVALRMNLTYKDARYNVNRVTLLDGRCRDYSESILNLINSAVDGEQCWMDTYEGTGPFFYPSILNVQVALNNHGYPPTWYKDSLTNPGMNEFNGGLVAGAYWSVVGPGKNLQLARTPLYEVYKFHWEGTLTGEMQFFDEMNFPARLPKPVTLLSPVDIGDPNGVVLTCQESENAAGYQLLIGENPNRVMDFVIISDTPTPPSEVITTLPFEKSWWTVRAYDQYGSTIYADPKPIYALNLTLPVENKTTGQKYAFIQDAIDQADPGDEIIAQQGTYHESIDFKGKNLTVRSINPDEPTVIKATVIDGGRKNSSVTFSGGEDSNCILSGFTISGGRNGIYCYGASPIITNCLIKENNEAGIFLYGGSNPNISCCNITANAGSGINLPVLIFGRRMEYNYPEISNCIIAANGLYGITEGLPTITNCTICDNIEGGISNSSATLTNSIVYFNGDGS
ncbi:MAG: right-handed parallel beta-helix repeat-containing protein, partial [Sedimentisphaerales bacterium]|nr:right-handed parallel beta-helix repeat-containing protein [Sedimentisphaerales bacterium]